MTIASITKGQVSNDDCARALDYGILNNRQTSQCVNGTRVDTSFIVTNLNAVPNFPFYYTNNFCGINATDTVNGTHNDVWYKVSSTRFFEMSCFSRKINQLNQPDTLKVTFWSGDCGRFISGSNILIPLTNGYSYNVFESPYGGSNLYLQISGKNPSDTVNITMCLKGFSFYSLTACYVGRSNSNYDSLCFSTKITQLNPTSSSKKDGKILLSVQYGKPPYKFSWNTGDTVSNLAGLTAGKYSVTVSDSTGCTRSYNVSLSTPTSMSASIENEYRVFPNPANDYLFFDFPTLKTVRVYDIFGSLAIKTMVENRMLDVSKLSRGFYTILIDYEGQTRTVYKRIAIER